MVLHGRKTAHRVTRIHEDVRFCHAEPVTPFTGNLREESRSFPIRDPPFAGAQGDQWGEACHTAEANVLLLLQQVMHVSRR